jgi:hypothetical protein
MHSSHQNFFTGNNPIGFASRFFGQYPLKNVPYKTGCCEPEKDGSEVFTVSNPFRRGVLGNRFSIGKKEEGCCLK